MPDTTHQEEFSTTEARQGRRRTGLLSGFGDRYRRRSCRHVVGAGIYRHVRACQRLTYLEFKNKGRPYIIMYGRPFESATSEV